MSPLLKAQVCIAGLARAERARRVAFARRERERAKSGELPTCDCCGAPIYRTGLCGRCAEVYEVDNTPTVPVSFTGETAFSVKLGVQS